MNIKIYSPDNLITELATLTVVSSCSRSEKINGENVLEFSIPVKNPASTHINEVNIIGIDGDCFDIAAFGKAQNGAGLRMADVECEHVSYRLNDPDYNLEYFTQTGTPTAVLTALLDGTGFTVGTVDFTAAVTYSALEAKSRRALLMEFAAILGGELDFTAFTVSIRTQRGSATPKALTVGRDVSVIGKQVNKRMRDAEGNPIIAYTCGVYNTDGLALGDVVTLSESGMAINATLRIVSLSLDPFNPRNSTVIEVGNSTKGLEDDLYRIETSTLAKGKTYYGARISPENGFESIRSDKMARTVMNADTFAMQTGDGSGSNWVNKLFFDPATGTYVFDGELSANLISALEAEFDVTVSQTVIVNNLTAQKGYIAELTVDQIDTSDKVQRYLASDTSPLGYWRGFDQYIEFVEARIEGTPTTVQVKNRGGYDLYWLDVTHTGVTEDVTAFPVLQYLYTELVKLKLFHEIDENTGYANPKIVLGAGNAAGRQKGYLYKDGDELVLSYENASGAMREIRLGENGIYITPYNLEGISFGANGFSVDYSGETFDYTWSKDGAGKITSLQIDGQTIPVTWP